MAAFTEIDRIRRAIQARGDQLEGLALATVVQVDGSSYRRTGARMLIQEDGHWLGAISGGCLEGNALRRAREVMRTHQPQLVTYDTRTDASAKEIGASLGCRGVIRVWIESLHSHDAPNFMEALHEAFGRSTPTHFARILTSSHPSYPAGNFYEADSAPEFMDLTGEHPGCYALQYEGIDLEISWEVIRPRIRLLLFGGGQDAEPLTSLARQMGWEVTVTDECAAKALPIRFPQADRTCHHPRASAVPALEPDQHTAAVLISHNFGYDKAILRQLVETPVGYIGVLGPRKRFQRLDEELEGQLSAREAMHAPVGLDIGGETPFEIALAIVAEIQAHFSGRTGGKLRQRKGHIHDRPLIKA